MLLMMLKNLSLNCFKFFTLVQASAELYDSPVKPSTLGTLNNLRQVQQALCKKKEFDKAEQVQAMP
jgi:hypothetical protein